MFKYCVFLTWMHDKINYDVMGNEKGPDITVDVHLILGRTDIYIIGHSYGIYDT